MTHAWLFTGPPGAGREDAARAFAAALLCPDGGCGHCDQCHQVMIGSHPDLEQVRPAGLSYGVKQTRELILRAAGAPTQGRFRVILFEDADRATESAANALLKAIEEPPPRTVWLLCAPAPDDLMVTIRSRCRIVSLTTPTSEVVAHALATRDGVPPETARFAARAAQGHLTRARALALDRGHAGAPARGRGPGPRARRRAAPGPGGPRGAQRVRAPYRAALGRSPGGDDGHRVAAPSREVGDHQPALGEGRLLAGNT